jgi:hypothetical protein
VTRRFLDLLDTVDWRIATPIEVALAVAFFTAGVQ